MKTRPSISSLKETYFEGKQIPYINALVSYQGYGCDETDSDTLVFPSGKCVHQMKIFLKTRTDLSPLFTTWVYFKGAWSVVIQIYYLKPSTSLMKLWTSRQPTMKILKEDTYMTLNISKSSTKIISLCFSLKKTYGDICMPWKDLNADVY